MVVDLSTEFAGIKLKNPIMAASGTFGFGREYSELIDINKLGAIVSKSITVNKREGNPPPRICETPAGMLNSIGLQNEGLKKFVEEALPFFEKYQVPLIASIAGDTAKEFTTLAETLSKYPKIKALEINISCPNVEKGGMFFGCSLEGTEEIVKTVRKATDLPLIVKLSPNVTDIAVIAKKAEAAGADAISLINTLLGMSIDINTQKPRLGNITGGLSGPAIKPIALRMVWQVAAAVRIPVIGIGGIMTAEDTIEFLLAGASAVQVGTANFVDPNIPLNICDGIRKYLEEKKLKSLKQIIGRLKL